MKKLILNQKSYLNLKELEDFKKELSAISKKEVDIVLFPSIVYLSLFKSYKHKVGTQNFYSYNYGDYTGEVNLESLKFLDIKYTMVNHNERVNRGLDSNSLVKEKLFKSLTSNFKTILVLGENKQTNDPFKFIKKELKYLIKDIEASKIQCLSIMYEPIWLESECQDINIIRKVVVGIKEFFISKYKIDVEVFYGGGVNQNNINEILEITDGVGIGKKSIDIKFVKSIVDKIR